MLPVYGSSSFRKHLWYSSHLSNMSKPGNVSHRNAKLNQKYCVVPSLINDKDMFLLPPLTLRHETHTSSPCYPNISIYKLDFLNHMFSYLAGGRIHKRLPIDFLKEHSTRKTPHYDIMLLISVRFMLDRVSTIYLFLKN